MIDLKYIGNGFWKVKFDNLNEDFMKIIFAFNLEYKSCKIISYKINIDSDKVGIPKCIDGGCLDNIDSFLDEITKSYKLHWFKSGTILLDIDY